MTISKLRFEGPWGHCILLVCFITFAIWYGLDARSVSKGMRDLLLIGPVSVLAVLLCAAVLIKEALRLRIHRLTPAEAVADEGDHTFVQKYGEITVMAGLAIYVVLLPFIGFDAATFLFGVAMMFVQGERNILALIVLPLVLSVFVVYVMSEVLSLSVPTLIMGSFL